MTNAPMRQLAKALRQNGLVRFYEYFAEHFATSHLKDLTFEQVGPHREMTVDGRPMINFGFDSFLGLDQHPRVIAALIRGAQKWGTQFGASRAFASPSVNHLAEEKIAKWLGTEAAIMFPSVTLANAGALPGIVGNQDLLVVDEHAHNSIHEGAKIAKANGVRVVSYAHSSPADLRRALRQNQPYRCAIVAIDGVYSMSGAVPPLAELNAVCLDDNAVLYIDDAHATGVLGPHGIGTVKEALGSYDNALVVGCLSKAPSCFGAFVGCTAEFQRLLKMRSSTYIFGGPVPPPYLEAVCEVIDILASDEYTLLRARLDRNVRHMTDGMAALSLAVLGGMTPIISVLIGDEEDTLKAGKFVFDRGYYVQSVVFPAVPYHAGVLRVQVNANHSTAAIDGLLQTFGELKNAMTLPGPEQIQRQMAA
jgi:7-keto-8-aminopelargonate synthetase-like enzyme